jgi:large repetitive protein
MIGGCNLLRKGGIMKHAIFPRHRLLESCLVFGFALLIGAFIHTNAWAFTVNVVDQDGIPVTGFKWLLEGDNTHPPEPGVHKPVAADVNDNTLAIGIHRSHAPVMSSGESALSSATIDTIDVPGGTVALPVGRYFVSVLPYPQSGGQSFDVGGAPIDTASQSDVTVYVRTNPIETAQISIKVFHDIAPLNNGPDVGEDGLAGFTVTIGDQGGDIVQDAFGNTLGTTYVQGGCTIFLPGGSDYCDEDEDGSPDIDVVGIGGFITDANGEVFVKNLHPNKYGVEVKPPAGDTGWMQTSTIEGTKVVDAWVRPNEPPFITVGFQIGPPTWHTQFGFVKEMDILSTLPGTPVGTINGQVRKGHLSRPPQIAFFDGPPPEGEAVGERCVVGLNVLGNVGLPDTVWIGKCEDGTGNFSIPGVPAGTYQIVVFDISQLHIISFSTVIVPETGGVIELGNLPTPMWFGQHEHFVYLDADKDARYDEDEVGIPDQNINLRFRDGTIYQAFPTDGTGFVPFQGIFPWFHWQVAEVGFADLEATGVRVVVDDGGPVTHDEWGEGKRTPQIQANGYSPARRETGPVLTQGFQIFAGSNTRFEWGKVPYDNDVNVPPLNDFPGPGDTDVDGDNRYDNNGGISGMVLYATTRAEDDPRFAAGEEWEPGVPRVQANLYRDVICNSNGGPAVVPVCPEATAGEIGDDIPDDRVTSAGIITPGVFTEPDIDNYPLNWAPDHCLTGGQSCLPGPEDIDRNNNGNFTMGDAIRVTWTDSWDDNLPEGCLGVADPLLIHGTPVPLEQCGEGLRTYNQARPAVFDGGYAFGPRDKLLVPGTYIVQAVTPPGYELLKEEDRNVDFGLTPVPAILPPKCVGDDYLVPPLFSFLTDATGNPLPGVDPGDPDNAAPYAGTVRPLCDRKKVDLGTGQNTAADFFVFTQVPKAARAVGLITDDLANELAPGKPSFTEKFAPSWISIAVFDYTGLEIFRTYSDEFGTYNWLAPSTYAIDLPTPSGVGPKMLQFCLNHPGPIPDPANPGQMITDPRHRPQYSTTCYPFNFEPGRVTYLDTPVTRTAAFVGGLAATLDCELPETRPIIASVINATTGEPAIVRAGESINITSAGVVQVRNPDFPGDANLDGIADDPPTEPELITRDYGFDGVEGTVSEGTVSVGDFTFDQADVAWGDSVITVNVPASLPAGLESGQLVVTKGTNGQSSLTGVTLTVGNPSGAILRVGVGQSFTSIQAAIDAASDDDLILVDPGNYYELPILYKRVKLQGAGAWSTTIEASHFVRGAALESPLVTWRNKLDELVAASQIGLLPEQDPNDPDFFFTDGEGPGIFVAPVDGIFLGVVEKRARIDGFQIRGGDLGGAIYANAFADQLQISNNRLVANAGNLGGAIRIGNPTEATFARGGMGVAESPNQAIDIRHNHILENGSLNAGGGIAIYKGAANYGIVDNNICGNFARRGGGGIAHRGLSDGGRIVENEILFNEIFQGGQPGLGAGGGGIEIAGDPSVGLVATPSGLTEGAGDVTIDRNLIQGNLGGAADGGAIALRNVNGDDVWANPSDPTQWHRVWVRSNLMVNNVTGLAGGGLSLQDTTRAYIIHNTIANNDSVATALGAFEGSIGEPTTPQVAGIVSRPHSAGLATVSGQAYSNPVELRKNILWHNRSFGWSPLDGDNDGQADGLFPDPAGPYHDLGVVGVAGACLRPRQSLLSELTCDRGGSLHASNISADPLFLDPYLNNLTTAAAADEGGNFVQVYYQPLVLTGDYHIPNISPAVDAAATSWLTGNSLDVDLEPRPSPGNLTATDIGADEVQP